MSGQVCSGCFTPREKNPGTHLTGGCVDTAAGLNTVEMKNLCHQARIKPQFPSNLVASTSAHFVSNILLYSERAAANLIPVIIMLSFALSWRKIAVLL